MRRRSRLRILSPAADDRQHLQLQWIHDACNIGPGILDFMPSFLAELAQRSPARFLIRNERAGTIVAEHVLTAFDARSRRKGLLGRDTFAAGHALVIAPTSAIHTFFMRFPIDVAFVAKDGRVLKTRRVMSPWRITVRPGAFAVIELPAGSLDASKTTRGDRLVVAPAP